MTSQRSGEALSCASRCEHKQGYYKLCQIPIYALLSAVYRHGNASRKHISGVNQQVKQPKRIMAEKQPSDGETDISHASKDPGPTLEAAETSERYSFFTSTQRAFIIFFVASAASFSTLSSFIYYPAIATLAKDLRVSVDDANLSVTVYMVAAAVTPVIAGDAADAFGRRPIFIIAMTIYLAANIGLAVQRTFAALMGLRVLQSVGVSGKHPLYSVELITEVNS